MIWTKRPNDQVTHWYDGVYYHKKKHGGWDHWTGSEWKRSMAVDLDKKIIRRFVEKPWFRKSWIERMVGGCVVFTGLFAVWGWIVWM